MASESGVLANLRAKGPANVGALSARLKVNPSEAHRILVRLKAKGSVKARAEGGVVVWEAV